jgi:hypothetical protein
MTRQYNLGLQYEFLPTYVLEAAFVGSSGLNVGDYSHNVNIANLVCTAAVQAAGLKCVTGSINGLTTNTAANAKGRVPYLGFQPTGLQQHAFDGIYNYSSLQVTIRKNFSRGLGFQAAYTWSKTLTNIAFDAANINNPNDLGDQYGQPAYSRPHRFILSYQYDIPGKVAGPVGKVTEGWTVSGLTTLQSGNPLTLFDNRGGTAYGSQNGSVEAGYSTIQLCPGVTYGQIETSGNVKDRLGSVANPAAARFFNTAQSTNLAIACTPNAIGNDGSFAYGNAGVGIVRGPHQLNFDFQAAKALKLTERQTLQFRAEFFNLFNHAQFALPGYTTAPNQLSNNGALFASSAANFGVITQTSVAPRLIQFSLRLAF